jgi:hypothetical protein
MIYLLAYYCLVAWVAATFLYKDGFLHTMAAVVLAPLAPVYIGGKVALDRRWRSRL